MSVYNLVKAQDSKYLSYSSGFYALSALDAACSNKQNMFMGKMLNLDVEGRTGISHETLLHSCLKF